MSQNITQMNTGQLFELVASLDRYQITGQPNKMVNSSNYASYRDQVKALCHSLDEMIEDLDNRLAQMEGARR